MNRTINDSKQPEGATYKEENDEAKSAMQASDTALLPSKKRRKTKSSKISDHTDSFGENIPETQVHEMPPKRKKSASKRSKPVSTPKPEIEATIEVEDQPSSSTNTYPESTNETQPTEQPGSYKHKIPRKPIVSSLSSGSSSYSPSAVIPSAPSQSTSSYKKYRAQTSYKSSYTPSWMEIQDRDQEPLIPESILKKNPALKCKKPNYVFYQNLISSKPSPGGRIDEIHQKWFGHYGLLESHHGYIQWLFPIFESAGMSWHSSALDKEEAGYMRQDIKSSVRFVKSFILMLNFYGMKILDFETGAIDRIENYKPRYHNLNWNAHNYLRISRMLMSLGELGFVRYKVPWMDFMETQLKSIPNASRSYKQFWRPLCDPNTPGYKSKTRESKSDREESVFFAVLKENGEEWKSILEELTTFMKREDISDDSDEKASDQSDKEDQELDAMLRRRRSERLKDERDISNCDSPSSSSGTKRASNPPSSSSASIGIGNNNNTSKFPKRGSGITFVAPINFKEDCIIM